MGLQSTQRDARGDVIVETRSFKLDLWFYKHIGGEVNVMSTEEKRRWWCLFLCKTNESRRADSIDIQNTYYLEFKGNPLQGPTIPAQCKNTEKCEQRLWAFGIGAKWPSKVPVEPMKLPETGGLLPVEGVKTRSMVRVGHELFDMTTATGLHP